MANKILLTFLVFDLLFLLTGPLLLAVAIIFQPSMSGMSMTVSAAAKLLLQNTPLTVAFFNAGLIFVTFLVSIPSAIFAKKRILLRICSWLLIACALVSLAAGLDIWFSTLQTRSNLGVMWDMQTPTEQSLLQQQFQCCGYLGLNSSSPAFQIDNVCISVAVATQLVGCVGPFASFANSFLDIVFTSMFGFVALDGILFLCALVVLKDRAQKERYRLIDDKSGLRGI
ncbi:phospholipid scramblase 1 [Xylographa carneopallida]|nr:phospholipid scramblase 1 [Xylographa carneopallida]